MFDPPPQKKIAPSWDNVQKCGTATQATQYGACALQAEYLRLHTYTANMSYFSLSHGNNVYANTTQCYVTRALPILFPIYPCLRAEVTIPLNILTYLLNPLSRVLLVWLTGFQLVKKFTAYYGTRRFITAFTTARYLSLSWASSIQSTPQHPTSWRSILILSSHLFLGLPSVPLIIMTCLLCSVNEQYYMSLVTDEWIWSLGAMTLTEKLGENPVPVSLCAPQITHRFAWDRI